MITRQGGSTPTLLPPVLVFKGPLVVVWDLSSVWTPCMCSAPALPCSEHKFEHNKRLQTTTARCTRVQLATGHRACSTSLQHHDEHPAQNLSAPPKLFRGRQTPRSSCWKAPHSHQCVPQASLALKGPDQPSRTRSRTCSMQYGRYRDTSCRGCTNWSSSDTFGW